MTETLGITAEIPASHWRPRPYFRPSPVRRWSRRTAKQDYDFRRAGGVQCKKRAEAFEAVRDLGGTRIELVKYRSLVAESRCNVRDAILTAVSSDLMEDIWQTHEYWAGRLAEIREEVKRIWSLRKIRHGDMEPLP